MVFNGRRILFAIQTNDSVVKNSLSLFVRLSVFMLSVVYNCSFITRSIILWNTSLKSTIFLLYDCSLRFLIFCQITTISTGCLNDSETFLEAYISITLTPNDPKNWYYRQAYIVIVVGLYC